MDDADATPWHWSTVPVAEVAAHVRGVAATACRPVIVAVDGRSGAGKSTVADQLANALDVAIWVEGDIAEQERRGVARDGADAAAQRFWDEWQAAERPLQERDRPWSRADLLILGTSRETAAPGTWWAHWGPGRRQSDPPAS